MTSSNLLNPWLDLPLFAPPVEAPASKPARGKVYFHTAGYEFSHGRAPRGRGPWGGSWAFWFSRNAWAHGEMAWFTPSVTYAEAKKLAAAEARKRGSVDVFVGS